jgi:hypothetical protein
MYYSKRKILNWELIKKIQKKVKGIESYNIERIKSEISRYNNLEGIRKQIYYRSTIGQSVGFYEIYGS